MPISTIHPFKWWIWCPYTEHSGIILSYILFYLFLEPRKSCHWKLDCCLGLCIMFNNGTDLCNISGLQGLAFSFASDGMDQIWWDIPNWETTGVKLDLAKLWGGGCDLYMGMRTTYGHIAVVLMNWKVLSFNIALLHLHMQFSVDVHCFVMLLWACIQFFPGIFLLRTWLLGFKNYKLYIFCRFEQGFQDNVSSDRVEFDQGTVYPWKTFSQHLMTLERQK